MRTEIEHPVVLTDIHTFKWLSMKFVSWLFKELGAQKVAYLHGASSKGQQLIWTIFIRVVLWTDYRNPVSQKRAGFCLFVYHKEVIMKSLKVVLLFALLNALLVGQTLIWGQDQKMRLSIRSGMILTNYRIIGALCWLPVEPCRHYASLRRLKMSLSLSEIINLIRIRAFTKSGW